VQRYIQMLVHEVSRNQKGKCMNLRVTGYMVAVCLFSVHISAMMVLQKPLRLPTAHQSYSFKAFSTQCPNNTLAEKQWADIRSAGPLRLAMMHIPRRFDAMRDGRNRMPESYNYRYVKSLIERIQTEQSALRRNYFIDMPAMTGLMTTALFFNPSSGVVFALGGLYGLFGVAAHVEGGLIKKEILTLLDSIDESLDNESSKH
jgi:hypothetical protein